MCMCARVCVCMRVRVHACVCACVRVRVCRDKVDVVFDPVGLPLQSSKVMGYHRLV